MKARLWIVLLSAIAMCGCAGLNVQWTATASYNTQALTYSVLQPGAKDAQKEVPAPQ